MIAPFNSSETSSFNQENIFGQGRSNFDGPQTDLVMPFFSFPRIRLWLFDIQYWESKLGLPSDTDKLRNTRDAYYLDNQKPWKRFNGQFKAWTLINCKILTYLRPLIYKIPDKRGWGEEKGAIKWHLHILHSVWHLLGPPECQRGTICCTILNLAGGRGFNQIIISSPGGLSWGGG